MTPVNSDRFSEERQRGSDAPVEERAQRPAAPTPAGGETRRGARREESSEGGRGGIFSAMFRPVGALIRFLNEHLPEDRPAFVSGRLIVVLIGLVLATIGVGLFFLGSGPTGPVEVNVPSSAALEQAPPDTNPDGSFSVQGGQTKDLRLKFTLASAFVILLVILGFAESAGRRERFAIDFWAPILFVLIAVYRKDITAINRDVWLVLQTLSIAALIVAVAWNENRSAAQAQGSAWSQVFQAIARILDLTPLYVGAALLVALKYAGWRIAPYPGWIPIQLVWFALFVGVLFELSRIPWVSLLALAIGATAGVVFIWWVAAIAVTLVVVMGAIFAQVGWLPTTRHANAGSLEVAGHGLTLTIRWDLVLMAVIAFFLAAIASQQGNATIFTITRLAGG